MAELDNKYYNYDRMRKITLTKFEDIEVGVLYHIPPTILYDRRDFICEKKEKTCLIGKIKYSHEKTWKPTTLYNSELSIRYLVKTLSKTDLINNN